jgi:hypothetical protein
MPGRVVRENKILVSTCIMELRRNDIVPKSLQLPDFYPKLLQELKTRIRTCQGPRRVRRELRDGSSLLVDRPGYSRPKVVAANIRTGLAVSEIAFTLSSYEPSVQVREM